MHKQTIKWTIKSLLQKQIILLICQLLNLPVVFCACSSFNVDNAFFKIIFFILKTNIYLFYNKIHKWTTAIKSLLQKQIAILILFRHLVNLYFCACNSVFNVDNAFSNWL